MAAIISKLSKGTLTFTSKDTVPVVEQADCQITNVILTQDAPTTEDPLETLCGDMVAGSSTLGAYHLTGTIVQDWDHPTAGVQRFAWLHNGEEVDVEFVPTTPVSGITTITGTITMGAIDIGGDVGVRNTSDFDYVFTARPVITPWDDAAVA